MIPRPGDVAYEVMVFIGQQMDALTALCDDKAGIEWEGGPSDSDVASTRMTVYSAVGGFEISMTDEWITLHEVAEDGVPLNTERERVTWSSRPDQPIVVRAIRKLTARLHEAGHL